VQLTVRRSFRIPRDSKARIYSDGFMGGKAIAIEMGDSPQLLSKGDTLVAARRATCWRRPEPNWPT